MNEPITMPALSDTMSNGRLVRWVKHIGDPIKKGDCVAEVETDKAIMDVEAFHDGYLSGPLAEENAEAPVGQIIGYIADTPSEAVQPSAAAPLKAAVAASPAAAQASPRATVAATEQKPGPRLSPYARRMAREHQSEAGQPVATSTIAPGQSQSQTPPAAGPPDRIAWPSSLRESVAQNMIKGWATPTFHVTVQLSVGALKQAVAQGQISLTLLLARAAALAVKANPLFNAAYTPEGLARRERVDVGIAVDTSDGLIAAVLRDVAERPLAQLASDWRTLRDRVNSRRLLPQDYQGATFYLSNLGTFPVVRSFDAVLPVGATAILCVGAAENERVIFTLGCDHRVVAGADAARFLQSFAQLLADPGPWCGTTKSGP